MEQQVLKDPAEPVSQALKDHKDQADPQVQVVGSHNIITVMSAELLLLISVRARFI